MQIQMMIHVNTLIQIDCNGDCLDGFVLVQGGGTNGTGNGDGSGQCISIF